MAEAETIVEEAIRNHFADIGGAFQVIADRFGKEDFSSKDIDDKRREVVDAIFGFWRGKTIAFKGYQSDGLLTANGLVDETHGYAETRVGSSLCEYTMEVHGGKLTKLEKRETAQLKREKMTDIRSLNFRQTLP